MNMQLVSNTSQPNALFSLTMLLFISGHLALAVAMTKRQRRYLRHYREQRNINVKLSDEFPNGWSRENAADVVTNGRLTLQAYRTLQPEPDLEQERRAIIQIHRIQIGWVLIGSVAIVIIGLLTS